MPFSFYSQSWEWQISHEGVDFAALDFDNQLPGGTEITQTLGSTYFPVLLIFDLHFLYLLKVFIGGDGNNWDLWQLHGLPCYCQVNKHSLKGEHLFTLTKVITHQFCLPGQYPTNKSFTSKSINWQLKVLDWLGSNSQNLQDKKYEDIDQLFLVQFGSCRYCHPSDG